MCVCVCVCVCVNICKYIHIYRPYEYIMYKIYSERNSHAVMRCYICSANRTLLLHN